MEKGWEFQLTPPRHLRLAQVQHSGEQSWNLAGCWPGWGCFQQFQPWQWLPEFFGRVVVLQEGPASFNAKKEQKQSKGEWQSA